MAFCQKYGINRRGTNSLKWDALGERFGQEDLLAMWVADMEFKAPEEVLRALEYRAAEGAFGYTITPDAYYDAFRSWQQRRHGIALEKEWIRFTPGVVMALYWLLDIFSQEKDNVLVVSPSYYPFYQAIERTGRTVVTSTLRYEKGVYEIDYDDFEAKIIENKVKIYIHCSPHNPTGRVWKHEELKRVITICQKHQVLLISDEIHQDIIIGKQPFISALQLVGKETNANIVVVQAASKTFNLASLLHAHVIIPNEKTRNLYDRDIQRLNAIEVSVLGQLATMTAYQEGEEWLDGLIGVIRHNFNFLKTTFEKYLPQVGVTELEGTYLVWIDLRAYIAREDIVDFIQKECKLAIDYGQWFGKEWEGFIRINLATKPIHVNKAVYAIIDNIKK